MGFITRFSNLLGFGFLRRLPDIYRLIREAFGQYKYQLILLVVLGFLSSILEAVGINALIPLFSIFAGEKGGDIDFVSRFLGRIFSFVGIELNLPAILIFISTLFLLKALVLFLFNYIKTRIKANYTKETRRLLFRQTLLAEWSYLKTLKSGYLETITNIDILKSARLLNSIGVLFTAITGFVIYLLFSFGISQAVTLMMIVLGGMILLFFRPFLFYARRVARKIADLNKEVARHITEHTLGIKTVKSLSAEVKVDEIAANLFRQSWHSEIRAFIFGQLAVVFIQPLTVIFISFVVAFAYYQTAYNLGALLAIVYLIQRSFSYIESIQSGLHQINSSVPYLRAVLDYQSRVRSAEEKDHGNILGATEPLTFNRELTFKNVSFGYQPKVGVLHEVGFSVGRGELVGLIGPSGAGKTTIFDLVLRFLHPQSGAIEIDGRNIERVNLTVWRNGIGYVSQDVFLLNAAIADNIRFYDDKITEAEIVEAAKRAQIYDFVMSLPDRWQTTVGERGVSLSAGQRQRIALARVLVRNPQLLLLDEATSALDAESEYKVQETIAGLKGKTTILVIAHRLSTIKNADRLIVLEDGKIIEEGRPEDLLKDRTTYFYKVYQIR